MLDFQICTIAAKLHVPRHETTMAFLRLALEAELTDAALPCDANERHHVLDRFRSRAG